MKKTLLISLSNNYDHQLTLYSLYFYLKKYSDDIYTLGISKPKATFNFEKNNLFIDAPLKPGLSKKMFCLKKVKPIIDFVRQNKIEIIYFETLHIWNLYIIKKLKKQCKIFHCVHDVVPHEGKQSFFVLLFNKFIFKNCNRVIVRSQYSLSLATKDKKVNKNKIEFIPILRNFDDYMPCEHTKRVMFFGRVTKYKGLDNLVEIISKLTDVKFSIIGKAITKEDKMIVSKIKENSNVFVNDNYVSPNDMKQYFKDSDLVILPYTSATQSGVIIDSYRLSRPCIAFAVGGIVEQIIDNKTGYLIKDGIDSFVKKIVEYLSLSDDEKDNMCLNAYTFGKENYSPDIVGPKFLKLFSK